MQVYRPITGPSGTHYGTDMAAPARHLHVSTDDAVELTLTVRDDQSCDGLPVLLLHGLSQQRFFWGPVISRMRSGPVAALDQRGHGESDTAVSIDYSIQACANDVRATLDTLGWSRAVVVGHSWGASVALRAAALIPDRVVAAALIDGGLRTPAALGDRADVRRRLTPPPLGIPPDALWSMIRSGELGKTWTPQIQSALEPTFRADEDGNLRTRIGLERHMLVLEGLLDIDPAIDLDACEAAATPIWAVVCEPRSAEPGSAPRRDNLLVHRWAGAIHDVPLQWPALVAGFVDALVDVMDGGAA